MPCFRVGAEDLQVFMLAWQDFFLSTEASLQALALDFLYPPTCTGSTPPTPHPSPLHPHPPILPTPPPSAMWILVVDT